MKKQVFGNIEKTFDDNGLVIKVRTINNLPSRTQQAYKDEVDVNRIMRKYRSTQDASIFKRAGEGQYGDFSGVVDFQTAHQKIIDTRAAFMQLDSRVRARFENDPGALLNFLNDERNRDEAISLGLIPKKEPVPTPIALPELKVSSKKKTTIIEEE